MDDQRRAAGNGAASLARAIDVMGADLYRALGAAAGTSTVFSPASIAIALQMALRGARGETATELARFLHLSGADVAGGALRLLSAELAPAAEAGDVTFRMPNTMWVNSGLPLAADFIAWIHEIAGADLRDADFVHEPGKARREINRVIGEQTAGKIKDLIGPGVIDAYTRLVLANAVYLKAAWAHPFPERATGDAPFHLADGGTVPVRMMHETAQLGYVRGDDYQAVILPYAGGRLAMAVVLPEGPLATLAGRLVSGGTPGLLAGARPARVRLALPRFRVEAQFMLRPVLERLGVVRAFSDAADFGGITTAEPLRISAVVHKAYIDVDEKGTEAAAATAVAVRMLAMVTPAEPQVTVTVDRPFLFAITDAVLGVPLFLGAQANPAAGRAPRPGS